MITQVVSLGDSFSCGEGVGVQVPPRQTWVAVLADRLVGGHLLPLADAGSVLADVQRHQLPLALAAAPRLVTLLVGLNDAIRGGFDPGRMRAGLDGVVGTLRAGGASVLLGRLHDPTRLLPVPRALRRALSERVAVVNAAVDEAGRADADVHVFDLDAVPGLRDRQAWDVDRLHPSPLGHFAIGSAALDLLARAGFATAPARAPVPAAVPVRGRDEAWWLVRHGLPWFAGRTREVALPTAQMALRHALRQLSAAGTEGRRRPPSRAPRPGRPGPGTWSG